MCYKKVTLQSAYADGLRRCPICCVQLVWKPSLPVPQKNLATVDHIIPDSMGGADTSDNMFVMCRQCNNLRGTQCFVKYVTEAGVSKSLAEELYRKAHIVTLQIMVASQFTQVHKDHSDVIKLYRKRRKQLKSVVKNYTDYFGDYLPEFQLLQKLL
jgi:hypothetical protein